MNTLQYIKDNITEEQLIALLEEHGARSIVKTDEQIRCTCMLHGGDNPTAFALNTNNLLWKCFTGSCGGGDVFDLIRLLYKIPEQHFKDVVKKTAEVFGISIEGMAFEERKNNVQHELQYWLMYMNSKNKEENHLYDLHRLGRFDSISHYRDFSEESINKFGLLYSTDYNRVTVPIYNEEGSLIGASLRKVDEEEKIKWMHRPKGIDTGSVLYNLNNVLQEMEPSEEFPTVYLTEGAFDVIKCYQLGVKNVVAVFGSHLTSVQEELLLKHFVNVVLAYDNDEKGKIATSKAIDKLKNKVNLEVLNLGDYKDLGEIPDRESFNKLSILKHYQWSM